MKYSNIIFYLNIMDVNMTNMTLAIPQELMTVMKKHREIRWSEVARQALQEKAEELKLLDQLVSKSKLTDKEAMEIGHKINP